MYANKDKKKEETVNALDNETLNERADYFSIYECGEQNCPLTYE